MYDLNNIVLEIKKIENEQQRRLNNDRMKNYNTGDKIHLKQMEFHKCLSKNRWVFGGNRSGKSQCGAAETVWLARGNHPFRKNKPISCWVVSLSTQVQRDVAQQKILSFLNPDWIVEIIMLSGRKDDPENGVIDYILIRNVFGSLSKIAFKSCDQGREKFQGTSLDFVWFDEEPPYDIYLECKMRVLDRKGEIFGTMTPLKGLTWVYEEIYLNKKQDPQIWTINMEWADNPYLDKNEIEEMSRLLSEDELDSRRYGKFVGHGGMVYNEFDPAIHIIEPFEVPVDWYDNISIDPGLHNPLSAHWYAVDYDGNIYVIAEHYASNKTVEEHSICIKEICKKLKWKTFNGKISALIDSAANQKTLASSKSVAELFYEYGINVNTNVNKDLFSGISRVKSLLRSSDGVTKLFIFKNCVNLIREIKAYWWGNDDAPIKKDDHALDELRYYVMSRPEVPKISTIKTSIQKHKDKLISKQNRYKLRLKNKIEKLFNGEGYE